MASLLYADDLMGDILKEAFQRLHMYVVENVVAGDIIHQLFSAGVLSASDLEELDSIPSPKKKMEKLLISLHRLRHRKAFIELRYALLIRENEVKYGWLVNELDLKYNELHRSRQQGSSSVIYREPQSSTSLVGSMNVQPVDFTRRQPVAAASATPSKLFIPTVSLVRSLPEDNWISGLVALDKELYVCYGMQSDIAVYDIDTTYNLKRRLSVSGLGSVRDMTSSRHERCIFISDWTNKVIHRIDVKATKTGEKFSKWNVEDDPAGLSVNAEHNLIVSCWKVNKIKVFTSIGKLLTVIDIPQVVHPSHTIQLTPDRFVVCHGNIVDGTEDTLHRVCIIDGNGNVRQSFGSSSGCDESHVHVAMRLAVVNGFIFVADLENHRVLMLSPTLRFIRTVVSKLSGYPRRMSYDEQTCRLYLGESNSESDKWTTGHVNVYVIGN